VGHDVGKAFLLFVGQDEAFMRTSYKGLPQRSILYPFMFKFYTRLVEACLHPLGSILQYADVRNCLKTSLTRLMTWFGDLCLSLSPYKSEVMVFLGNMKFPW
jgi:hypothetical protein